MSYPKKTSCKVGRLLHFSCLCLFNFLGLDWDNQRIVASDIDLPVVADMPNFPLLQKSEIGSKLSKPEWIPPKCVPVTSHSHQRNQQNVPPPSPLCHQSKIAPKKSQKILPKQIRRFPKITPNHWFSHSQK